MSFLTSFRTLSPATSAHRSLDDFFNDRFRRLIGEGQINDGDVSLPPVNIEQHDNTYTMEVSMPGFRKSDIEISVKDDVLQISANRADAQQENPRKYLRQEFRAQRFYRNFHLPENADEDKISATYEDGILRVTIPLLPVDDTPEVRKLISVK